MDTEAQAIQDSKAGDTRAFGRLVLIHHGSLRAFLRSRVRDWTFADDVAQEVFLTAYKQIAKFQTGTSFAAWIRGIAINHLRNSSRKRKYEPVGCALEVEKLMERESPGLSEESSSLDALQQCLRELDPRSRNLLTERYVKGKTVKELSQETGRKHSTLSMQFLRMRDVLLACVKTRLETNA